MKSHPPEVHQRNAADTDSPRHKSRIEQWIADGCIAIIGHAGEKETFSGTQEYKAAHLDEAVRVRNVLGGIQ